MLIITMMVVRRKADHHFNDILSCLFQRLCKLLSQGYKGEAVGAG